MDDYTYGDDEYFVGYVSKAIEPGVWLFFVTIGYLLACMISVVPLTMVGRKCKKWKRDRKLREKAEARTEALPPGDYEMVDFKNKGKNSSSSAKDGGDDGRSKHLLAAESLDDAGEFQPLTVSHFLDTLNTVLDPDVPDEDEIVAVPTADGSTVYIHRTTVIEDPNRCVEVSRDTPIFHETTPLDGRMFSKGRTNFFLESKKDKTNKILRKAPAVDILDDINEQSFDDRSVISDILTTEPKESVANEKDWLTKNLVQNIDNWLEHETDKNADVKEGHTFGQYNDYVWNELPGDVLTSASLLGYTKTIWNNGGDSSTENYDWGELSYEQQTAANMLGYSQATWDGGARQSLYRESKLTEAHNEGGPYDDYNWKDLPDDIRAAAYVLGYNGRAWDLGGDVSSSQKSWKQLNKEEKSAATLLGYTREFWDQEDKVFTLMENTIRGWETFSAVVQCGDRETRKIMRLAVPGTLETILGTLLGFVETALISYYLGPTAFAACSLVGVCLSLTESITAGMEEALEALVSQAIGLGNFFVAGQYVQLTTMAYTLVSLPMYIFWIYVTEDLLLWLNLDENIASLAGRYVPLAALSYYLSGLSSSLNGLLRCDGKAIIVAIVDTTSNLLYLAVVAFAITECDADLITVVWIEIIFSALYGLFLWVLATKLGWLDPYKKGMVRNMALKDWPLVKGVLKVSIPLSIGSFLSYGEWEVLTIFAASMGPAEVVAWAIAGSIWEIFEYAPAGISSAAVMRVGIHLGNGNPRMAKIAAYKTLLYSLIWSSLASALFIHLQDEIIGLFTEDETLTGMLQSLVLLISFGNVFMCMGGSAWHIITAQSRTKLATKLFFTCMWCITIPLSAVFVFVFSYNLEALVSAMVLGYSTLSFALLYLVFISNWQKISMRLISKSKNLPSIDKSKKAPEIRARTHTDQFLANESSAFPTPAREIV